MTQEHIDLLTKDLSARLHYRLKIKTDYITTATLISIRKNISYGAGKDLVVTYDISGQETPFQGDERWGTISKIKPYLFPLSSMTEEQSKELEEIDPEFYSLICENGDIYVSMDVRGYDWLNKNHFDYRGLIPMGLAIDATNLNIY